MQASSVSSSFDLKAMDSNLRAKVQNTLAGLNARQDGLNIVVRLPSDVLFDFDRADIRADAKPVLARLSEALVAMPDRPVSITGHTDSLGSDDYNHTLSERRSVAVREWLSRLRVRRERMTVQGMGEAKPVAPNQNPDGSDNPDGRQKNRRVDFVIGEGR